MKTKIKRNLLYIIGVGLLLLGMLFSILFISLNCRKVTIGEDYFYKFGDFGESYAIEVTAKFSNENFVTYDAFMGNSSDTVTARYKISSDGYLFVKVDSDDWEQFGKVNAYEVVVNNSATEYYGLNFKLVLECKSAKIARNIYIIFLSISFFVGVGCIIMQCVVNVKSKSIVVDTQNDDK